MPHEPGHEAAAPVGFEDIGTMPIPGAGLPEQEVIGGFFGGGQPGGPGGVPYAPGMAPDPYYDGEEFDILRGLTTEDRVRLQQQLVAVGLASGVVYGEIDGGPSSGTVGAMRSLLAMANRSGEEWPATLGRIATNPAMQEEAQEFEPTPYIRPDYATLAQEVKATFRQRLGRDPDQGEMEELTAELTGFDRQAYETQLEFDQIQHEQANTPGVQPGGSVTKVDPAARFAELFDQKYKHELDFVQDKEDAVLSRQVVESGASTLSQMSRRN